MRVLRFTAAVGLLALAGLGCKKGPVPIDQIKDIVPVVLDEDGFHPSRIPALVGRPITLVVTRKVEKTCATAIVIAQEDIRRDLPMNMPTMVTFIPERAGEIHFACPTNELNGEIAVQDVEAEVVTKPGGGKPKIKMKKVGPPVTPGAPAAAPPAAPAPGLPTAPAAPALPPPPAAPGLPTGVPAPH